MTLGTGFKPVTTDLPRPTCPGPATSVQVFTVKTQLLLHLNVCVCVVGSAWNGVDTLRYPQPGGLTSVFLLMLTGPPPLPCSCYTGAGAFAYKSMEHGL